jgi:hypothetical protein
VARNRNPLFEWTGPAMAMRFGLGALLGLFLGLLVLALVVFLGPWRALENGGLGILLIGVPAACGVLGIFALRQVAAVIGQVFEDIFG